MAGVIISSHKIVPKREGRKWEADGTIGQAWNETGEGDQERGLHGILEKAGVEILSHKKVTKR